MEELFNNYMFRLFLRFLKDVGLYSVAKKQLYHVFESLKKNDNGKIESRLFSIFFTFWTNIVFKNGKIFNNKYYDKLWLEYLINDKHLEPKYINLAKKYYNDDYC